MKRIVAVTACPTGVAHTLMAAEALKKTAAVMGHQLTAETQGSDGPRNALSAEQIAAADVVILAADIAVDQGRFAGKPIYETSTSTAIRQTGTVIEAALVLAGQPAARAIGAVAPSAPQSTTAAPRAAAVAPTTVAAERSEPLRLVGITSCPTGIAHTFMAAEGLKKAAAALGHTIKVETQGSVGAQNKLTDDEIDAADAVVIAADTNVDQSRFAGKRIFTTSTNEAINNGQQVIRDALNAPAAGPGLARSVDQLKSARSSQRTGVYKHLMTGVSYMLPFVVAGGLLTALAFAIGGINVGDQQGTFAAALKQIGDAAFSVYVGVLAAFIAFSIADRPGIVPGLIGGLIAQQIGAGFLGGILAGFLAGYITKLLNDRIDLGANLNGLKPVLILPFLATIIIGLLMFYVIGQPVALVLNALTGWLTGLQTGNALVVGLILGAMMGFDMGGPVNKSAYTFAVGLLASNVSLPMAAVMAAGMTPPLGLALAAMIFRNRFDDQDRQAAASAFVLGLSFISEGAIPYATKDPLRVIPALMIGSATAGAISMAAGCALVVSHGGVFVLAIPNAVSNLLMYIVAILAGTLVTAAALYILKRPLGSAREPNVATQTEPITS